MKVNVSANLNRLGTYYPNSNATYHEPYTVHVSEASTKSFYLCNDVSQHLGEWAARPVWINNYGAFAFNFVPPSISVNGDNVTITLGYAQCYLIHVRGHGNVAYDSGAQAPDDIYTYYLPVTVYYS